MNLLSLDSEQLGIPETTYGSVVTLPSSEFTRICRELATLAETVTIETTKEYVRFSISGDNGTGNIMLKA